MLTQYLSCIPTCWLSLLRFIPIVSVIFSMFTPCDQAENSISVTVSLWTSGSLGGFTLHVVILLWKSMYTIHEMRQREREREIKLFNFLHLRITSSKSSNNQFRFKLHTISIFPDFYCVESESWLTKVSIYYVRLGAELITENRFRMVFYLWNNFVKIDDAELENMRHFHRFPDFFLLTRKKYAFFFLW